MNITYKRFFAFFKQFLWPYKGRFVLATLLSGIGSAVGLYYAYAFALIVNFVINYKSGDSLQPLYLILATWVGVIFVRYFSIFFAKYMGVYVAERAAMDVEIAAINHLSKLDISWHEKENTGNKLKRFQRGGRTIVDMTRIWLNSVIDVSVNFVGALIIISRFDFTLASLMLLYLALYYALAAFSRAKGVRAYHLSNIKEEEITGLFFEITANIRSVKVLGMAKKILDFAKITTEEYLRRANKRIFWFQASSLLQGIWEGLARVAFISFIIWGILNARYEVGFLILFYGYFNTLSDSVGNLAYLTQDIAASKVNIGRLTDILDEPINIDAEENKREFPASWDVVKIKNLSFNYGNNAALSNINLEIRKGEKVGIVGLSGAGKSTLFKLLLKEYENYEGEISVGGVLLKDISKTSYIKHIAPVLQDTEVFNMTLHQNIVLANSEEKENKELFERALDIAHIRDFLPKLPMGAETVIGERGVKLSGGEKQRLGIARAVFKGPEILFLDEATSHLDVESEQKIQDSLKKFFKDVTAIVIAHRLSTIREMDRIVVIEGGKILESGSYDELYAKNGRFREFWDKQKGR